MKPDRTAVSEIIFSAIAQIGDELEVAALANPDETTRLMGDKAALDSIALVSLIAEIEAVVSERFDVSIVLADERAMSATRSPFRRAGVLIDYVYERLQDADQ